MSSLISILLLILLTSVRTHAVDSPSPTDGTIIQADGEAQTRVPNDFLTIDLTLVKEGMDLALLHEKIQKEANIALEKAARVPSVKAKTSGYNIYPVYEKDRIARHRASYRIVLETQDFEAGLSLAASMQPFTINNLIFSISPELRKTTEKTLIEEAISDMRGTFSIAANTLGAKNLTITHLTIGGRQYQPIEPRLMRAAMAEASPVAAEAGESQVIVTVSGSALAK